MTISDPPFHRIDDASLAHLVVEFYAAARLDPVLGPVFQQMVGEGDAQWAAHLRRVHDFWSSVTLGTGRYDGRPMQVHAGIPGLEAHHFQRWLALFAQTVDSLFTPPPAAALRDKAERMSQALQQGLTMARSA
ncbi:hypothetical protein CHU95_05735 [Niveispirillum lacus]|uniref:Globin n=1 Tax=Niveispirillum lacus TaxID=1981099 RepID=A0A255Z2W5_9PROT|nr:group III truncated hemoglobin [Niveispirillum lacus]OYQ35779.1 hypothetical protein CHU95_05735 [Niveispirillum lacus]